ncbi:ABC-type Fe3+ transport system permease subunit [Actinoplanes octamycinicus]|uniref:ABC-type Fe3+ transport system permease subunit n=1 Tax=Actinoplanes octamycinicus TaxID=135948 RepID=A0A7W7H6J9_9ACTN|nr:hypothetical protein [Actinoplanes octamycinicus]MBB4744928.1 ABC-type Fe3+ transport system permease subunit [Actinoplanes octamycinicus]GIE55513.1 hypothetical protein Aoc01nite_09150 [Actinoplanes octamycinicus]
MQLLMVQRLDGGLTVGDTHAYAEPFPVTVFTLTDRGQTFDAAAATLVLLAATLVVLLVLGRLTRVPTPRSPS